MTIRRLLAAAFLFRNFDVDANGIDADLCRVVCGETCTCCYMSV